MDNFVEHVLLYYSLQKKTSKKTRKKYVPNGDTQQFFVPNNDSEPVLSVIKIFSSFWSLVTTSQPRHRRLSKRAFKRAE